MTAPTVTPEDQRTPVEAVGSTLRERLQQFLAFASLIAACYVLGSHYRRAGNRRDAVASRVAGTALLVGDLWASGGGAAGSLTLAVGAITAMLWVAVVANRYR